MRTRGTIALVLLFALGVCASPASAEPLAMTFTESRANVGVQLDDEALFGPPDTAPFAAQIDPGTGLITAGALAVPRFSTHITEPIVADVTVDFAIGKIEGKFNRSSGELNLAGVAGGTLTAQSGTYAGEECGVSTVGVLELSTDGRAAEDGSPRDGSPFTAGLTGPGSLAGQWTDMEATPVEPADMDNVSFCDNVDNRIGGPGGVWLDQKGSLVPPPPPPPPPPPGACVVPKLAGMKLKAAKRKVRAAGCTVGKVRKPKRAKGRTLVVKSSNPAAGTTKPASAKVHLKLGPKSQ